MGLAWRKYGAIVAVASVLLAIAAGVRVLTQHSDALRHIALEQCVPNVQRHGNPAPCARVNLAAGYMVIKDRHGWLQFLLMPTQRINGVESPLLLDARTSNYFWLAWQARALMSERRGRSVPDAAISLSINSRLGRTQDHLHIHISCLRKDVRERLNRSVPGPGSRWLPLPGAVNGHDYLMRRVSAEELTRYSPFMMLAKELPEAKAHMGRYALALAQQPDGSFVLLTTQRNLLQRNLAFAEELQDHDCAILTGL
ncbi:CDP-diacylglycerol diphosphatase [Enterobacteriaceae bacterium YMB-R22]|uniref:CDP-diacylglycerol diphosphatase n=1 Tax=Tenebrionicola larvae TaxID=2815733 RepID=UPI0020117B07|nr:CDP-diacylglycerol diphosphatase [Tenebrionicola larvae]MBV4414236.1 CDP-diacylglycerol diphosphatase [Tenebrionicola larvae]